MPAGSLQKAGLVAGGLAVAALWSASLLSVLALPDFDFECYEYDPGESTTCPGGFETYVPPSWLDRAVGWIEDIIDTKHDIPELKRGHPCHDITIKFLCATLIPECNGNGLEVLFPCQDDCEVFFEVCLEAISDVVPEDVYDELPVDCSDAEDKLDGCKDLGLKDEYKTEYEEARRQRIVRETIEFTAWAILIIALILVTLVVLYKKNPAVLPDGVLSRMEKIEAKWTSKKSEKPKKRRPPPGGSKGSKPSKGGSKGSKRSKGSRGGASRGPKGSKGSRKGGGSAGSKGSRKGLTSE